MNERANFIIIISADAEWDAVIEYFVSPMLFKSPYGDWFVNNYALGDSHDEKVVFFHGGWGKVSAAASTQYLIDRWNPRILINLGTCGGIEGAVKQGEIILVTKTIIYDIFELMGDPVEHVKFYETTIDNSWIGPDSPIMSRQAILLSADRDLFLQDVMELQAKYNAIAADWESGSIAWVAHKNDKTCLILRGVTDLVNSTLGEAYNGNMSIFLQNTKKIMRDLLDSVPKWIELVNRYDRRGLEK